MCCKHLKSAAGELAKTLDGSLSASVLVLFLRGCFKECCNAVCLAGSAGVEAPGVNAAGCMQ